MDCCLPYAANVQRPRADNKQVIEHWFLPRNGQVKSICDASVKNSCDEGGLPLWEEMPGTRG